MEAAKQAPVFILASSWRSGSTLAQRLMARHCLVWGEPFGHAGLFDGLFAAQKCFTKQWPQQNWFYKGQSPEQLERSFVANLYPDIERLLAAQRAWFDELFAVPARAAGFERWGIKEVRLTVDHAWLLKRLFPEARLIFLIRNPYDAYRSYAARHNKGWRWYARWPDQPLTLERFGRHWRELTSGFVEQGKKLGGLVIQYEDIVAGNIEPLERYLSFPLSRDVLALNPSDGGPPPLAQLSQQEFIEFSRQVEPLAAELGYSAKEKKIHGESAPQPVARSKCAILVPVGTHIEPACDAALHELERRGYTVMRKRGCAAIDQARNQLATDALDQGFEETMWVDSDVAFEADDVDRLRSHGLPIVCGIYPKKGQQALAIHTLPGTPRLTFGKQGGLVEIKYASTGFLLVRREVYEAMQQKLALPVCNTRFPKHMVPYFQPMVHQEEAGPWYLAEDWAFCERARQCGYRIMADTAIRLWHIGTYRYGWEDAGEKLPRHANFTVNLDNRNQIDVDAVIKSPAANRPPTNRATLPASPDPSPIAALRAAFPWPGERPSLSVNEYSEERTLPGPVQDLLRRAISKRTHVIVELGAGLGTATLFLAEQALNASIIAVDCWRPSTKPDHQANEHRRSTTLYEAFLANCWDCRDRIVPLRMTFADALRKLVEKHVSPNLIYIGRNCTPELARTDLEMVLSLFPRGIIVGEEWNQPQVRQIVSSLASDYGLRVENDGPGWRLRGLATGHTIIVQ